MVYPHRDWDYPGRRYYVWDHNFLVQNIETWEKVTILVVSILGFVSGLSVLLSLRRCTVQKSYMSLLKSLLMAELLLAFSGHLFAIDSFGLLRKLSSSYSDKDGEIMRKVIHILTLISVFAILLNLLVMTLEHFLAIIKPLHYPIWMSHKNARIFIGFLWVISGFLGSLDAWAFKFGNSNSFPYRETMFKSNATVQKAVVSLQLWMIFICMISLLYIYVTIYKEVKNVEDKPEEKYTQTQKKKKKIVINSILILLIITICLLPYCIRCIHYYVPGHDRSSWDEGWNRKRGHDWPDGANTFGEAMSFNWIFLVPLLGSLVCLIQVKEIRKRWKMTCCCLCRYPFIRLPDLDED